MKHILPILTAALLGVAAPVFAETLNFDGFSVETTPYNNGGGEGVGEGSYYTITKKGSGSLFIANYLQTMSNDLSGQGELLTDSQYGITHYGYIDSTGTYDFAIDDPRIKDQFEGYSYSGWVADPINHPNTGGYIGTTVVPRDGYFLGNFEDGDVIQIYLARKVGNDVLVSVASNTPQAITNPDSPVKYTSRWGAKTDTNPSNGVGELFFPDGTPEINFVIMASTTRNIPGITDVAGGPVGSPLPGGVQIALIAGLFGLGFWYIRRRKAAVA